MLRRKEIMDKCPEGFEGELSSYIDDIESIVSEALGEINDATIRELSRVDAAYDLLSILSDYLY